jgi:hypothetical protein
LENSPASGQLPQTTVIRTLRDKKIGTQEKSVLVQGEALIFKEANKKPPHALVPAFDRRDLLHSDNGEPRF